MTKTDDPCELLELDGVQGPILFNIAPAHFAWRHGDEWLEEIDQGYSRIVDRMLPYLERQAACRLRREWSKLSNKDYPSLSEGYQRSDYEQWRDWWLNEVSRYCSTCNTATKGNTSLSAVGQAAVNIFIIASRLRLAIEQKQVEKASALGMMLVAESLLGGYALKYSAAMTEATAMRGSRRAAVENGFGKGNRGLLMAEIYTVAEAKHIWEGDSTLRIGEVAEGVIAGLKLNREILSKNFDASDNPTANFDMPGVQTVKEWIKKAARQGKLVMPDGAQSRGRPRKNK